MCLTALEICKRNRNSTRFITNKMRFMILADSFKGRNKTRREITSVLRCYDGSLIKIVKHSQPKKLVGKERIDVEEMNTGVTKLHH